MLATETWLAQARTRVALGDDDGGERAYLEALRIDGAKFKKISFGYLADAALRDLGFETIEKLS